MIEPHTRNVYPPVTLALNKQEDDLTVHLTYRIYSSQLLRFELEHSTGNVYGLKDSPSEFRKKFPFNMRSMFPDIYSAVFFGIEDLLDDFGYALKIYDRNEFLRDAWFPLGGFKIFFSGCCDYCDLYWGQSRMGTFDRLLHFTPNLEVSEPDYVKEVTSTVVGAVKDALIEHQYFDTSEYLKRFEEGDTRLQHKDNWKWPKK